MICVPCAIGPSPIHGHGVFATEFIPAGTVTWREDDRVDLVRTREQIATLPDVVKEFVFMHCYRLAGENFYRYVTDQAQFMNHSVHANCRYNPERREDTAVRDILAGEEITTNYHLYNEKYLKDGKDTLTLIEPAP